MCVIGRETNVSEDKNIVAKTGAEALLLAIKSHGVDYLFANAGTDFPPIIEALTALPRDKVPEAITIPHETASVAMAHGYYLVTGRPQCVMVHVNVGLANAAMGVINAASDNVPILVMSGRTPITELGRRGSRMTPIQAGQEMYDQSSLVSNSVKHHYEMRYPEQGESIVSRALALANSTPEGPVYLSLPREALSAEIETDFDIQPRPRPAASRPHPDPRSIEMAAEHLKNAKSPLILVQRGDVAGELSRRLQEFSNRHAIAVCEPYSVRNVMPTAHPMFVGHDISAAMGAADVVVVLDCDIPWIEALDRPADDVSVIHIGPDPHFTRMPVRGHRTDMAIQSDAVAALVSLDAAMEEPILYVATRSLKIEAQNQDRRTKALTRSQAGSGTPLSAEWLSKCLSDAMDEQAIVFSELGILPAMMALAGPNRVFSNPHSGGLGWAIPAALGAQLADRDRLVIACVGDGSYIFANPTACHQIAEALQLPVLVIIKNNGMWNAVRRSVVNAYPEGTAVKANSMPLTSLQPAPDYLMVAGASGAYTEKVEHGSDLPAALTRAITSIRKERRAAVLEVNVAISDNF